jgi:hypothetical protein
MRHAKTRGTRAIFWVENFCRVPNGPYKGRPVKLSPEQRQAVRRIYDNAAGIGADAEAVPAPLAGYLARLHICGPEAVSGVGPVPQFAADSFSLWNATGPELRAVLKRDGERIICPELGTRWPSAA